MRRKVTAVLLSVVMALGAAAPGFAAPASNNRQQTQQQNANNQNQKQNANKQQTQKQTIKETVTETTTLRQAVVEKQTVEAENKQNNKTDNRVTEQTREPLTEVTTEYTEMETRAERETLAEGETLPERETLAEGETRPERPTLAEGETRPEPQTDEEGNPIQFKDGEKPDFDFDDFDFDDDDKPDFDDFDFDDDDRDDWDRDDRDYDRRDFDDDDFDEDAPPFEDVERDAWYYKYVKKAYKKGYISGKNEKSFAPSDTVTGAELIVMLFRAEGNTLGPVLAEKRWYQNAVDWAWENNILTDEIKDFDPDTAITREQVMYILCRYLLYRGFETKSDNDLKEFNDRDRISDYAVSSAGLLVDEGIISGTNGNLNPEESLTRAEGAAMLVKIFEDILDE